MRREADDLGLRHLDALLVAGLDVPDECRPHEKPDGGAITRLVRQALRLSEPDRKRLLEAARSLPVLPRAAQVERRPRGGPNPPGFGAVLVRMLALRNLTWTTAPKVIFLMSGVLLAASSIGLIADGRREVDAELLIGVSAVLGIPAGVLQTVMGVDLGIGEHEHPPEHRDVAELIWEVRQRPASQVRELLHLAGGS